MPKADVIIEYTIPADVSSDMLAHLDALRVAVDNAAEAQGLHIETAVTLVNAQDVLPGLETQQRLGGA